MDRPARPEWDEALFEGCPLERDVQPDQDIEEVANDATRATALAHVHDLFRARTR